MQMFSLSDAVELASAPDFDARMYGSTNASGLGSSNGGRALTDEELARQLASQSDNSG